MIKKTVYLLIFISMFLSCEDNLNSPAIYSPPYNSKTKVLLELFSNVMCAACFESGNFTDDVSDLKGVTTNDTNVVVINIHTSLFQGDPFFQYNPQENAARELYYNVNFNPTGYLMGEILAVPFAPNEWISQINSGLNKPLNCSLILENVLDTLSGNGTLNIKAGLSGNEVTGELRVFIVLTENKLLFNAPNGKTIFNNVLRKNFTGLDGELINLLPGSQINLIKNYSIPPDIKIYNSNLVVFVQEYNTKKILAVEIIRL